MKEIRVGPTAQLVLLLTIVGLLVLVLATQFPEVRRYLKVRAM
jgi:hypothetical protein